MISKPKNLKPVTRAAFGVFINRQGHILVGDDSGGRIAFPGGKFEVIDNCNAFLALRREIKQEVGKQFQFRPLLSQPKIFCTGADVHTVIDDPVPNDKVDLRFFFLLEALNEDVMEKEPAEFKNPRFVDLATLEGKLPGIDMRYAAYHALELFRRDGSLSNDFPEETPDIDYPHIRETLKDIGFGYKFCKDHGRPLKSAVRKARATALSAQAQAA